MSSYWGSKVKISIFGESHGKGIGVVVDNLPAGEKIDIDELLMYMGRRAPGKDKTATPRLEKDFPQIMSGMLNDTTTGTPLCAVIENTNTRSGDYGNLLTSPRPGHGDYTGFIRYNGFNDIRGGGHFSGRLTAPIVFAGSVCRQILERRGIKIASHIYSIGKVCDTPFNPVKVEDELIFKLNKLSFPVINSEIESDMRDYVENARLQQDSTGGVIECVATGVPAGLGSPMFGGVENLISSIVFGVPAVKGIEFGAGFAITEMLGSQSNDQYAYDENGNVITLTNNNGGITGGITNGMPVLFRTAIKPTPSISKPQKTVDLTTKENTELVIKGRHDPCIVPRATVVIESALAIALLNLL
ncbi:MAG: chorismate synthase [Acutalibacteraceae bacterium]|nr:chorismate synthase [Acutalibacteraceae bacterium]